MPACPNCKAPVESPERVYKVVVEPSEGERGVMKRDVGMYRCPRCDTTFPRVLGRVHYLLVAEAEHNRMKKEIEDKTVKIAELDKAIEALTREKAQREEALTRQLRESVLTSLESQISQLDNSVKQLEAERERLKEEIAG